MNEILSRLKNSINKEVLNHIDKSLMEQYNFVPISVKDKYLFVAVNSKSDKSKINTLLKEYFPYQVKFIQIGDKDLIELISYLSTKVTTHKDEANKAKLGEMLIQKGYITDVQLLQALAESKRLKSPIGSTLFKLGFINMEQLKSILHQQTGYDLVSNELLARQNKFVNILPEDFIKANEVIPVTSDGKTLTVGVVKPLKSELVKEIIFLTGQNPKQLLMTHYEFEKAVDTFFSEQSKETKKIIEQIEEEASEFGVEETLWEQVDSELKEATGSVAKFTNQIITNAIDNKVSDIHIEPRLNGYIVRYRKDGMLQKVLDIPAKVESSVIARIKVLSRMNIAEHRRPQDGTFSINYKKESYDFRINTLPVSGKEKMVIRILAPAVSLSAADRQINLVGASDADLAKVKEMVTAPNGIILTSGPTGSGKTTTLYSILKSLNDEHVNITTIEDPIEIKLEGINQSQINPKAGITFASCMRAILRQDPDIILVGEIRDYETLEIAISAALTGHLVLSTVHTNSAAATVTRLIEMGAKDYLVSSTLTGVIAQRLVRTLCPRCKEQYFPTHEEARQISTDEKTIQELMKTPMYRAMGCNDCEFTGYKGRLGLFEVMPMTKEIKKLIAQGAHDLEIEEAAIANGMTTLNDSCIEHIKSGETTVEEFVRVLGIASE